MTYAAKIEELITQRDALWAEIEACRVDAERYRWLREAEGAHAAYSAAYFNAKTPAEFDADIVSAMLAERLAHSQKL